MQERGVGFPANDNPIIVYACECGNQLFFITPSGFECDCCGRNLKGEDIWG